MVLDRQKKYCLRDNFEVTWRFIWGNVASVEGWWGERREPGQLEWGPTLGVFAEAEVERRLSLHAHPLTNDDLIDLHIWLAQAEHLC